MSGLHLDPAEVFRQESAELLDRLEETLLDLGDRPGDRTLVDTAFRALHTIKGSGAMFGFDQVARFTHDFETAFDLVRQGRVAASRELVDVSLSAKDYIRVLIERPDDTDPIIGGAILEELQRLFAGAGGAAPATSGEVAKTPPPPAPEVPAPSGAVGWRIAMAFDADVLRNGTNPLALLDDLRELGPCTVVADLGDVPPLDALVPEALVMRWTVTLAGDVSSAAIEDVFLFVRDEMTLTLTPLGDTQAAVSEAPVTEPAAAAPVDLVGMAAPATRPAVPDVAAPEARDAAPATASATVRVQAERLDELMDRVGELVIAQARLTQLVRSDVDPAIKAIAEEIERLASGLRDITMGVRMVPMGSLFARFRRLVHDLSRDLGKPVEFVTAGEDTELDKTMIERLADPLVHLIRNAIDHGIEAPERRTGASKSATGRIELSARYVGAQVHVTVRDDGAGLDVARIRAKAQEQGLVSADAVLSDQDVFQFLFHPGFSTASTISALSGRGVGMDVVKRTIEAMRGSIDLSTVPGQGSMVLLRLPLTLAIIDGLLIRVGEGRYIIPLSAVEECIELGAADDCSRGRSFLNIRGDLVPFMRLRDLFGDIDPPDPHQKVIVTTAGDTRVGLVVDQIIGSHQTVIKSLSKLHADVTMFSGATILGDGSAALILDVAQLVALGETRPQSAPSPAATPDAEAA